MSLHFPFVNVFGNTLNSHIKDAALSITLLCKPSCDTYHYVISCENISLMKSVLYVRIASNLNISLKILKKTLRNSISRNIPNLLTKKHCNISKLWLHTG